MLLGFVEDRFLKRYYSLRPCDFIYPDESLVEGSIVFFNALLNQCLAKKKYPMCWANYRVGGVPRMVCLLPQAEERDECNLQKMSAGFHVVYLPYADDIRELHFEKMDAATEEQTEKATAVIETFLSEYDPILIENPSLQKYYRNLEALALDKDCPDDFFDATLPDLEKMELLGGESIQEWSKTINAAPYKCAAKNNYIPNLKHGDNDEVYNEVKSFYIDNKVNT
jgi:ATP-dependent DNA helicase 2 subunit 1